jgi:hypothetical protein
MLSLALPFNPALASNASNATAWDYRCNSADAGGIVLPHDQKMDEITAVLSDLLAHRYGWAPTRCNNVLPGGAYQVDGLFWALRLYLRQDGYSFNYAFNDMLRASNDFNAVAFFVYERTSFDRDAN